MMNKFNKNISKSLLTSTIACAAALIVASTSVGAFAAAISPDADQPTRDRPDKGGQDSGSISQTSNGSSESSSNDYDRFRVCFYTEPNFEGRAMCKTAPSRVGIMSARLSNSIKSIKITNYSGRKVYGPHIKLKLCDNIWRKGECQILNSSQVNLAQKYDGPIRSYAFDVKS